MRRTSLFVLPGLAAAALVHAGDPANQPELPDRFDTDNALYTLLYNDDPTSPHFFPAALIVDAADGLDRNGSDDTGNPRGYDDGYRDLGLAPAWFEGEPELAPVRFWDCADPVNPTAFDCDNGFARVEQIVMPAPEYRARSASCLKLILGHELFHHVEFGYVDAGGGSGCGGVFGTSVCEGQARAMQDKVYFDLDLDPAANCVAAYDDEADGYLANPDITVWKASYGAALFWTYLMEQYGDINAEPNYGADFITSWWELAQDEVGSPNVYDITERTLKLYAPTHSLVNAYHDFTIANLVKDLSVLALPAAQRARYTYVDDGPVLAQDNKNRTDKVDIDFFATVPASGAATIQLNAQRFGGDYAQFDLSACPSGREVEFSIKPPPLLPLPGVQTPTPDALISLVLTQGFDGMLPSKLYKWRAKSAKTSFVQPNSRYTRGNVIVSGWHGSYPALLTMRCLPAPLNPGFSLQGNHTQPRPGPQPVGSIGVALPSGATGGPIGGLGAGDFQVRIGGVDAPIHAAVREGDGYRLHFAHPALSGPGPFALAVQAGAATTTLNNAVRYDDPAPEVIVVLDLSASMGQPAGAALLLPAIQKVREAAARMRSTARFGLVGHFGNGSEPGRDAVVLLPLGQLDATHRASLETALAALTPSSNARGAPGDGVLTAIDQFQANGGNGPRSILLIGDGARGEGDADVSAALRSVRAALTTIALGGASDQPMFQAMAATGEGTYHYVPTSAAGMDVDAFDLAFDAAHLAQTREHVLLARQVDVPAGATVVETLTLPAALLDANGGARFTAMTPDPSAPAPSSIRLFRPGGGEVLAGTGVEITTTSRGRVFKLDQAAPGDWTLQIVGGSAAPTGPMTLTAAIDEGRGPGGRIGFSRPDEDATPLDVFRLGDPVEVHYLQYKLSDVLISSVIATVERPDGSTVEVPMLPRPTRNGFAAIDPDVYVARLDLQNAGSATGIADDGSAALQRGSYRVIVRAVYGDRASGVTEVSTASFAVLDAATDGDGDGLPDRYEAAQICLDMGSAAIGAGADADGDGLTNAMERVHGTDPCDVDSDDGGETDASEIAAGANPLDAGDDALAPIGHAEIVRQLSGHEEFEPLPPLAHTFRFDNDRRYDSVELRRGPGEDGPFATIATIDAGSAGGGYVDTGLTEGTRYCYQLVPRTDTGRVGAGSEVLCSVAREDMTAPTGSLVLDQGAPQSRANTVIAGIAFDNESSNGAEMNLELPDGSETGWIPFQRTHSISVATLPRPGTARVGVVLRDAAGNESERYHDTIELIAADAAGNIVGSVRGAAVPLQNATVRVLDAPSVPLALTASNGGFGLVDLPPGTYTLVFSYPGFQDALRTSVVLTGGSVVNLGTIDLVPVDTTLFANGFE